jgi:hypothetical protein
MRRAVEGALHNVPADCPSSYLYILSRQYLRWAQFQVANEDHSARTKQPQHKCKEIRATCPLLTTNSVMAEHGPEPVVYNFNPRNYFQERFVLKLSSHLLCLYGGVSTRIPHFLLPGVTAWPTYYNLFFLLAELSAASTSDDIRLRCVQYLWRKPRCPSVWASDHKCVWGAKVRFRMFLTLVTHWFEWLVYALSLLGRIVGRNAISRNLVAGMSAIT